MLKHAFQYLADAIWEKGGRERDEKFVRKRKREI
jgi:hypothetical protein